MDHKYHIDPIAGHPPTSDATATKRLLKHRSILDHIYNSRAVWDGMGAGAALSVDFANAYPTMSHELCEAVLPVSQLPDALYDFFCGQ